MSKMGWRRLWRADSLAPHPAGPSAAPEATAVSRRDGLDSVTPVDLAEAEEFIHQFHGEVPGQGGREARLAQVRAEIAEGGAYRHTSSELAYGAKVAWRNSRRCIGRLYWNSLIVRDRRHISTAAGMFTECLEHLRMASNGGRIRPAITIFPAASPGRPGPRILNSQLIRYAGYRRHDGSVIGDPAQAELTSHLHALGWPGGPGTRFDVLPLAIETAQEGTRLFMLPRSKVLEVELSHPTHPWFTELGLRWPAVPAITNMPLSIGGITYTAAPFSGWYMGTEIGARNLGDANRYNQLPEVALRLGLDTTTHRSLWIDQALVELNRAVLHSFDTAGVKIADHHSESQRFLLHLQREEQVGRRVPVDWTWIVPPLSGSATPVFHRYYDDFHALPNFLDRGCPEHD
jgi:nitric-oxide synthase, bacterial